MNAVMLPVHNNIVRHMIGLLMTVGPGGTLVVPKLPVDDYLTSNSG